MRDYFFNSSKRITIHFCPFFAPGIADGLPSISISHVKILSVLLRWIGERSGRSCVFDGRDIY